MIQMGTKDGLWIGQALLPQKDFFSGTKRGVFCEETLGGILILERLAEKHGSVFSFHLHHGGHTDLDLDVALRFFNSFTGPQ